MKCHLRKTVIVILNPRQLWIAHIGPAQEWAHQPVWIKEGLGPWPSAWKYLLLIDSGRGRAIAFSCVLTGDSTGL